jgi:hypothetical protein
MMFVKGFIPAVSLGEVGVREWLSSFFITQFGELNAVGFNAAMFLFIINVLIPSVPGLFLMFKKHR